jgi:hypothetical protein
LCKGYGIKPVHTKKSLGRLEEAGSGPKACPEISYSVSARICKNSREHTLMEDRMGRRNIIPA